METVKWFRFLGWKNPNLSCISGKIRLCLYLGYSIPISVHWVCMKVDLSSYFILFFLNFLILLIIQFNFTLRQRLLWVQKHSVAKSWKQNKSLGSINLLGPLSKIRMSHKNIQWTTIWVWADASVPTYTYWLGFTYTIMIYYLFF